MNGHLHSMQHVHKGVHYMTIGNAAFQTAVTKGDALFVYPTPALFSSSACKEYVHLLVMMSLAFSDSCPIYFSPFTICIPHQHHTHITTFLLTSIFSPILTLTL